MSAISVMGHSIFKSNFNELIGNLRRCFISTKSQNFYERVRGTLELLLVVNELCSSKQGAKSSTPVLTLREKGNAVDVDYSGVNFVHFFFLIR
ncbi:Uncharacterized protein APZ42_018549 [Daphnia magna]|uniref:Uncharacterized protein n=1 Tax=Daphnia magna TaxID=35525 RepID=A0A164Z132_9CRUS|nr:Uncharacterized protein APZ42_018549 [Daphnia magna]